MFLLPQVNLLDIEKEQDRTSASVEATLHLSEYINNLRSVSRQLKAVRDDFNESLKI